MSSLMLKERPGATRYRLLTLTMVGVSVGLGALVERIISVSVAIVPGPGVYILLFVGLLVGWSNAASP